jgi:hypothetical protein
MTLAGVGRALDWLDCDRTAGFTNTLPRSRLSDMAALTRMGETWPTATGAVRHGSHWRRFATGGAMLDACA